MFLIADNPASHPAIAQIFEVIAPLDEAYGLDLPPLEMPEAGTDSPVGGTPEPAQPPASRTEGVADSLLAGAAEGEADADALRATGSG